MAAHGDSVVYHLPAYAGDTYLIPGPDASQLPSLCSRIWELHLRKPTCPRPCAPQVKSDSEKPEPMRVAPARCNQRKACAAMKTQHSQN